jgi:4-azaleucine resistance transporter AzlC
VRASVIEMVEVPPRRSSYWTGARAVLPLSVAIGLIGVSFGVLATSAGLSPLAATVMSITTFAGSAQFAAVTLFGSGAGLASAVGAATLLNARYLAMGAALAPTLQGGLLKRVLLAQLAVDESWAVAYEGNGRFSRERLVGAALLIMAVHVLSTAIGALAGEALIADPAALGLDAAFPALFVILIWPHVQSRRGRRAATLGVAIALGLTPVVPPGVPVLAAAAAALLGLRPE